MASEICKRFCKDKVCIDFCEKVVTKHAESVAAVLLRGKNVDKVVGLIMSAFCARYPELCRAP